MTEVIGSGLEVVGYFFQHEETGNVMSVDAQQVDWGFEANNPRLHRVCALTDYDKAQAILDGLRGEVADLRSMLATVSKAGLRVRTERDQQAQRIGELASHLEFAVTLLTVAGLAGNAQVEAMRAALSAGNEPKQCT